MDDAEEAAQLAAALDVVGLSAAEQQCVYRTVAGVLELGQPGFVAQPGSSGELAAAVEGGLGALAGAAGLLGLEPAALEAVLISRRICARDEWYTVELSEPQVARAWILCREPSEHVEG